ncbi:cell division protein FtsQ [Alcaligenaceae bacterium]|nr:cell division protein FtsQ [Alcaligenaceae bacterium]
MTKPDTSIKWADSPPRSARAVAGVVLIIAMAAACASILWGWAFGKVDLSATPVSVGQIMDGRTTRHIADQLSHAPVTEALADIERAGGWLLFGNLGDRVRQGCPGWLFLTDELTVHAKAKDNAAARLATVVEVRDRLHKRGINLLVLVVPDKSRIEQQKLCAVYRPDSIATRLDAWAEGLRGLQVQVVDSTSILMTIAKAGQEAPFLRTDTHWNELGAKAAAGATADWVRTSGVDITPTRHFKLAHGQPQRRIGDLVKLAGIDWLPIQLQPAPDQVAQTTFTMIDTAQAPVSPQGNQGAQDEGEDLFGDVDLSSLALIGTSYSRTSEFASFLESDLGTVVPSFAKDGGDFWASAENYFSSPDFEKTPANLVIWEIPERVIQMPIVAEERAWMAEPVPSAASAASAASAPPEKKR